MNMQVRFGALHPHTLYTKISDPSVPDLITKEALTTSHTELTSRPYRFTVRAFQTWPSSGKTSVRVYFESRNPGNPQIRDLSFALEGDPNKLETLEIQGSGHPKLKNGILFSQLENMQFSPKNSHVKELAEDAVILGQRLVNNRKFFNPKTDAFEVLV